MFTKQHEATGLVVAGGAALVLEGIGLTVFGMRALMKVAGYQMSEASYQVVKDKVAHTKHLLADLTRSRGRANVNEKIAMAQRASSGCF